MFKRLINDKLIYPASFKLIILCICIGFCEACGSCDKKPNKKDNKKNELNHKRLIPITDEMITAAKNYKDGPFFDRTPFLEEVLQKLKNNETVDINAKDPYRYANGNPANGETALHRAINVGDPKIVETLLSIDKLDVNATSNYGGTPLLQALRPQCMKILDLLLNDPRIDVNKTQVGDQTPLYRAVENNYKEIVERLLKVKGIENSFDKEYHGKTPLGIAKAHGKSEIEALLLAAGATK